MLLDEIDIDVNHFNEIYPSLTNDNQSNYYDIIKFNDDCSKLASDFALFQMNARSLYPKFDEFSAFISCLDTRFDSLCITETWLTPDTEKLMQLSSYKFYCCNRSGRRGGGVGIFMDNKYNVRILIDLCICINHMECIFIECCYDGKKIVIGCIYRPPGTSSVLFIETLSDIVARLDQLPNVIDIFICGDFNFNLLNHTNDDTCLEFINLMSANSFIPLITKPSRINDLTGCATLLDNIFCRRPVNFTPGLILSQLSDHYPVFTIFKDFFSSISDNCSRNNKIKYRQINDVTISCLCEALAHHDFTTIHHSDDINESFSQFVEVIMNYYNTICPIKEKNVSTKDIKKPWIDTQTKIEIKKRNKLFKLYRNNTISGPSYRRYRNKVTELIRFKKRTYFENKFEEYKDNTKEMWRLINDTIRPSNCDKEKKRIDKLHVSGTDVDNSYGIACAMNTYFVNVGRNIAANFVTDGSHLSYLQGNYPRSMFFTPINPDKVIDSIMSNKDKKCNINDLPITVLKRVAHVISPTLSHLVNNSISSGVFPDCLKMCKVVPIFKGGDALSPSNYRPISILHIFSKMLEKLIHEQIYSYLETNNIFSNCQFGFRRNKGTTQALLKHTNYIYESLDNNNFVFAMYLDLRKAFDSVDHEILLSKLYHYGIRGLPLDWFRSYLSNRQQCVIVNEVCSSPQLLTHSVPQGGNLSALLFSLYINDLPSVTNFFECVMYADDCAFSSSITRENLIDAEVSINLNLDKIYRWLCSNKIMINSDKTKYILYSYRGDVNLNFPIMLGTSEIAKVDDIKYLGVILDKRLCFTNQINSMSLKISRAIGMLGRLRQFYPTKILKSLYYVFIHPYFMYGIEVWYGAPAYVTDKLKILQKRAVRYVNCLEYRAHTQPSFQEMNLLPLDKLYEYCIGVYMFKTITVTDYDPDMYGRLRTFCFQHYHLTRNREQFIIPYFKRSKTQSSIMYSGIIILNKIMSQLNVTTTLPTFKKKLKSTLIIC